VNLEQERQTVTTTATIQITGRTAQVSRPSGSLEFTSSQYDTPDSHEVRIKIQACGVCHSDSFTFLGAFPGMQYPIAPGHEIIGIVDEVGAKVGRIKKGDRVGVGWHGGHCHECTSCLSGDFATCIKLQTPGITVNGGYAEYAVFPEEVCALVPDELSSPEAAPLMCAGVTTYNALRNAGARPGDTVAILGIGGLGHLAVQFANKMGFRTVAIARGDDKAEFAKKLGAHHYINSESNNAIDSLIQMGGAKVILSTITNSKAMSPWVNALAVNGRMVLEGVDFQPVEVIPVSLIRARSAVTGWPSGTGKDSEDCMKFAALTGIRPMIETFPLDKAQEAYERMLSGKARFRAVLTME
jgi:D-arabinose 1-dehydrogenase-like Zn-dependent alcohol dehydrogenase